MSGARTVLITGASRGIGRATALALADAGFRVALAARDEEKLREVALACGAGACVLPVDLADAAQASALVARGVEAMGTLDALVSGAAVGEQRALAAVDVDQIDRHLALNVRAPLLLAQGFAAHRAAVGGGGAFVQLASSLALAGVAQTSVYSATKGAMISMTRSLAIELAPIGLRVNAIAPGVIDTEMVRAPRGPALAGQSAQAQEEAQMAVLAAAHPLGRVGRPAEVADAVLFLLRAEFATGSVLVLDGGASA